MANAHGEECSQENSNSNVVITQEQYGHIMNLLQQFQIDSSGEDSKNNVESNKFAGTILYTSSIEFGNTSCKCSRSSIDLRIIDSGASNHMTHNKSSLKTFKHYPILYLFHFQMDTKSK